MSPIGSPANERSLDQLFTAGTPDFIAAQVQSSSVFGQGFNIYPIYDDEGISVYLVWQVQLCNSETAAKFDRL